MKGKQAAAAAARRAAEAGDRIAQLEAQIADLKTQARVAERAHAAEVRSIHADTATRAAELARRADDAATRDAARPLIRAALTEQAERHARFVFNLWREGRIGVSESSDTSLAVDLLREFGVPHLAGQLLHGEDSPRGLRRQTSRDVRNVASALADAERSGRPYVDKYVSKGVS